MIHYSTYQSQFIEMFGSIAENSKQLPQKKLGEVATLLNGRAYKANELLSQGKYIVLRVGNFFTNSDYYYSDMELEPDKYCDTGDLLYSWSATLGAQIWNGGKVIYHYHIWKVVFDEVVLNKKYFCYMLNYMTDALKQETHGSTMVHLTKEGMEKKLIVVPSMEDQNEFSSILEQADKSKFTSLKSQFIEMFYGRETTPAKEYLDDSYPGEWGSEDKDGNGVKVIRTTNFTNTGKLNLEDVVTRNIEERKVTRKQIRKFDTILERSGGTTDNPVGRVVLFEDEGLFLCNNFTQVLRFKDIDPRYAFYALYFFYQTNKTAIRSMGSKTTGIQNLNMSKYLEIGIPNATQDEQNEFVRIAEQADKSKFELRKSIDAIDAVIKSLING